jgi:hypothetical protein
LLIHRAGDAQRQPPPSAVVVQLRSTLRALL